MRSPNDKNQYIGLTALFDYLLEVAMVVANWILVRLSVHSTLTIFLTIALFVVCSLAFWSGRIPSWNIIRLLSFLPLFWAVSWMVYYAYVDWRFCAMMQEVNAFSEPQRRLFVQMSLLGKLRTLLIGLVCSGGLWRSFRDRAA